MAALLVVAARSGVTRQCGANGGVSYVGCRQLLCLWPGSFPRLGNCACWCAAGGVGCGHVETGSMFMVPWCPSFHGFHVHGPCEYTWVYTLLGAWASVCAGPLPFTFAAHGGCFCVSRAARLLTNKPLLLLHSMLHLSELLAGCSRACQLGVLYVLSAGCSRACLLAPAYMVCCPVLRMCWARRVRYL